MKPGRHALSLGSIGRFSMLTKVICVVLAFACMVITCDMYVGWVFHNRSIETANGLLERAKLNVSQEVHMSETALALVAQTVRRMIAGGADEAETRRYLTEVTGLLRDPDDMHGSNYVGVYGYFHAYGGSFLDGNGWQAPAGYEPTERPWYLAATGAGGQTAVSMPYLSAYSGEMVLAFSQCVYGGDGEPLFVLSLDMPVSNISRYVSDISLSEGSYGILIYGDSHIVSHPNPEMVGRNLEEIESVFSGLMDELRSGGDYAEREGVNYEGVLSVTFFSSLGDGWTVSIVVPKDEYNAERFAMQLIISLIGASMTVLLSVLLYSVDSKRKKAVAREYVAVVEKQSAQAADALKSEFLANMSHEIRTPMNAVLGMTELLLHESLTPRQQQYVEDMKLSSMALLGIINDILDISKIQSGKYVLVPVHYDFDVLIDNIGSVTQFLLDGKRVSFRLNMQEHPHLILYGDDVRLRQVFLNLISNAIKFTNEGSITLTVGFSEPTIRISVSDTGIGIPPESIGTLFDAFEQVNVLANRNTKGTGLGLTITKSIVDMMGGSITVESVYGQGTTFHVEIPKVIGDETLIQHGNTKDTLFEAPEARVLVVDDNKTNLSVACGLMRIFRIEADTADSGSRAVEKVQEGSYDLIFMDHRMPGMTGVETAAAIRGLGVATPIIALTASVYPNARDRMLIAGMNDYLTKPLIKSELVRILKKWLPADKLIDVKAASASGAVGSPDLGEGFWERLGRIRGLDVGAGLERVSLQRDVYAKTLRLMAQELRKGKAILSGSINSGDLGSFGIEAHGMKGSLANVGAMALSAMAHGLEEASDGGDLPACREGLAGFMGALDAFLMGLDDALSAIVRPAGPDTAPPELAPTLLRLMAALDESDLVAIDGAMESLGSLSLGGALMSLAEDVGDAVMMMDYAKAIGLIKGYVKDAAL
ncbi:MAG: ATP-binding protein [Oscillospiraceae bacterium]|nr:ATP-binding protein [Oscillospiraceae bacterium]